MKETLSAWMDDELSREQAAGLLPQIKRDAQLRRDWDCYHLIGDALRGVDGPDLCASIRARIDAEPTVFVPQRRSKAEKLRWSAMSLAASVAAMALVSWFALSGTQQDSAQVAVVPTVQESVQLAAVPAPHLQPVAVAAGPAINDYLLAHQRYSPSNAIQGVATYVRTVAVEQNSASR
jgi:sigma-E factor negative regulatory protein RseA